MQLHAVKEQKKKKTLMIISTDTEKSLMKIRYSFILKKFFLPTRKGLAICLWIQTLVQSVRPESNNFNLCVKYHGLAVPQKFQTTKGNCPHTSPRLPAGSLLGVTGR